MHQASFKRHIDRAGLRYLQGYGVSLQIGASAEKPEYPLPYKIEDEEDEAEKNEAAEDGWSDTGCCHRIGSATLAVTAEHRKKSYGKKRHFRKAICAFVHKR